MRVCGARAALKRSFLCVRHFISLRRLSYNAWPLNVLAARRVVYSKIILSCCQCVCLCCCSTFSVLAFSWRGDKITIYIYNNAPGALQSVKSCGDEDYRFMGLIKCTWTYADAKLGYNKNPFARRYSVMFAINAHGGLWDVENWQIIERLLIFLALKHSKFSEYFTIR